MINNVVHPYLPKKNVSSAFISENLSDKCRLFLADFGVKNIEIPENPYLEKPVASHPDMNIFHIKDDLWISDAYYQNICSKEGINSVFITRENEIAKYPKDSLLNAVILNNKLFCRVKSISREILYYCETHGLEIINVNQGYTKCNTAIVDSNSVITEDKGLYKVYSENKLNVLLLENNSVLLKGYSNGFVGGASFKLNKDLLAFSGNINKHPEYLKIKSFCSNVGVDIISMSDEPLYDYGSFIPIKEEDTLPS